MVTRKGTAIDDEFWNVVQLKLKAGEHVTVGDYLVPVYASSDIFKVANNVGDLAQTFGVLYQATDNAIGGTVDGDVAVLSVGPGSLTIGDMGGVVSPGGLCKLHNGEWISATTAEIGTGVALGRYMFRPGYAISEASVAGDLGAVLIL